MQDYTMTYPDKKTFEKYDNNNYILYLNESLEDYKQADGSFTEGYSYTGNFPDGGTLITAHEASYASFVSGLIRLKYSESDVEALMANYIAYPKTTIYKERMAEYQTYRTQCKEHAKKVLGLE